MNGVSILFVAVGLLGCTRSQTSEASLPSIVDSTHTETTNDFYSVSRIYGDVESDKLLFPADIMRKIEPLRTQGKEIEGQPYGGGDCWGKVRRYVLDNDTLTIDKHNCGEYGFGNKVFLKKGDSLTLAVTYRIDQLQSEKGSLFNDLLEIVEFRRDEIVIKTGAEPITDWNKIELDRLPRKSDHFKGQNASVDYLYFLEEYNKIKAFELTAD